MSTNAIEIGRHLSERELPLNVRATTDPREAIEGAKAIVHAIPMQSTEGFLRDVETLVKASGAIFVSTSKGLREDTLELMHDLLARVLGEKHPCAFFGGPTFAKQLVDGTPSGGVMAAKTMARRSGRNGGVILGADDARCIRARTSSAWRSEGR